MSKGYVILAQNSSHGDYVKMAYVLALSIKVTQSKISSVTLITDVIDSVPHHYRAAFDHIIEIPWYDDAYNSEWKIENRWKIYHITPYDETIVLDADMLALTDISHWWKYLSQNHNICFVNKPVTYRNEIITETYYRTVFVENDLPNFYSAVMYFKKSDFAMQYWKLVELITKNWQMFYSRFLLETKPKNLSMDVTYALAAKIMDIQDVTIPPEHITFVHMKGRCQNWKLNSDNWREYAAAYIDKTANLKVGNYKQTGLFHYTEKDFVSVAYHVFEDLYKESLEHG